MKSSVKWSLVVLTVAALAFGGWRWSANTAARKAQAAKAESAKAAVAIELAASDVTKVELRELSAGLPISGALKAANSALVKARVAGELQGLSVREGDAVKAGQVIARIDTTEAAARVRQTQEQADAAKAQIDIAQRQHANNKALVNQGFISQTALDTSQANLNAAQANHKAALAALDLARKSLEDTVLKAPISGIVSQRLAQPGERVGVDARVVEIVDLSRLEIEAALPAADSVDVRVGQKASLAIEGRPEPIEASVVRVNPSATAGSRQVLVYLSVSSTPGLRQGLFAQGSLRLDSVQALSVPLADVRTDKPQPYVALIDGGRIKHQSVELGARGEIGGQAYVAIKNAAAGSLVMKTSAGNLREGTAVQLPQ
jgi:RND family efflux transporter MFP subunit